MSVRLARAAGCGVALALALAGLTHGGARAADEGPVYEVRFEARIVPTERIARAEIRLGRGASALRWLRFDVDPQRHLDFSGDGRIEFEEGAVRWTPPESGGTLRYVFRIDHLRTSSSYDARCADHWALFRGGDLFPPARVRMRKGAVGRATLRLRVPARWSLAVPWPRAGSSRSTFTIEDPTRSFDRPTGWMLMGRITTLEEEIAGTRVVVAGPVDQDVRRHDLLAFLRWTLPAAREVFGGLPERLLLVGAGDPMWRGGLSGPQSAFLHAARPLIAHDGTSPVLHEIVHVVMHARSGPEGDWIAEGFAEYYAVELLARSGTLSREGVKRAFRRMADRGRDAGSLFVRHAGSDVTARAATVLRVLDRELRRASDGEGSLDDVAALLMRWDRPLTPGLLRAAAERVAGRDLAEVFRRETGRSPALPGDLPAPAPDPSRTAAAVPGD
ncbi:MAG: hypothetical protein R3263_02540 [Myxococcota bacterium]|nr:hypothetical protein [Myxococcota bacterium]